MTMMTTTTRSEAAPIRSGEEPTATVTPSIYQQTLGEAFDRLHPRMQLRFGFAADDQVAHIGRGVMHRIARRSRVAVPFLHFFATRNLLFPETGTDVPFMIKNYAYRDRFDRETVTWHRTFRFPKRSRIFEATMIRDADRNKIVDYLGDHQNIAADLDCWVDEDGGMNFTSGEQRFYEGPLAFVLPTWFTGTAHVREWWDENEQNYRIDVHVKNPLLGTVLHYEGRFDLEIVPIVDAADIPDEVKPVREESRP